MIPLHCVSVTVLLWYAFSPSSCAFLCYKVGLIIGAPSAPASINSP